MNINAEFHFYDTVLKVVVYCRNTPDIKKEVEIMYVDNDNDGGLSSDESGYE